MAKSKKTVKRENKFHPLFFSTVGTLLILISLVSIYLFLFTPMNFIRDINIFSSPGQSLEGNYKINKDTTKQEEARTPQDVEIKEPEIIIHKINEIVKFTNAHIKIEDVISGTEIKSSSQWRSSCTTETGVLVKVRIYYKNTGNEPEYVSNFNLYDSKNRKFKAESMPMCLEKQIMFSEKLNPGLELTFESLYELPNDAEDLKLKLSEYIYVSLGF
ncbi:MAG: DUF4352 domain-containing protein [Candidatus Dojkabacteria bacterium]|jgi:hypothetical protein|nr:DUF4352 domain-containing protein [Candidatus Dojkabacteria bacterium]